LSVLAGNIFYSWQARKLAKKEGRDDVTALPYGINTVTVFAFFSLIIVPVYLSTKDAHLAWAVGVASAFISGVFEGIGAFVGDRIRKITPRAALLSTLAGMAIVFIALDDPPCLNSH
jgi:AGZA family xanthine/uracil permease-like MFS transporter